MKIIDQEIFFASEQLKDCTRDIERLCNRREMIIKEIARLQLSKVEKIIRELIA